MSLTAEETDRIMRRMGKAIFSGERALLEQALTPDAEWHFAIGEDDPDGRVRRGVDGFLTGIADNDALFERLRFDDIDYAPLGDDRIVMTYMVDGKWRGGEAFRRRGVEIITARDGRVARKDVFWKQHGRGGG
jgi:ketosteroid isomerase-like protein